jgi:site-specific recombinase XerD
MPHQRLITRYLTSLRGRGCSPGTIRTYESCLRRAHAQLPHGVAEAADDEIADWLFGDDLWQPKTRATYLSAISGLHRWLFEQNISDYNPTTGLAVKPGRRLPDPLTDDEMARVLAEATDAEPTPVRLWCTLAGLGGLRRGELIGLDRSRITAETIRVIGKGDKQRVIPTHPQVWEAVRGLPAGPVVRGSCRKPGVLSTRVGREFRTLGITRGSIHRCRHWFASALLAAGVDCRVVQVLMGHSSLATTQVYLLVSDLQTRQAVATLSLPVSAVADARPERR